MPCDSNRGADEKLVRRACSRLPELGIVLAGIVVEVAGERSARGGAPGSSGQSRAGTRAVSHLGVRVGRTCYLHAMGDAVHKAPPGFDELPVEEQIEYVSFLWERIAAHPERVPVPEWHQQVLEERLRDIEENPDDESPWEDVEARLARRNYDEG